MKDLLDSRGQRPTYERGQRVQIDKRTGSWGEDNLGTVERVASSPDPKGRFFIDVLMDGMPNLNGRSGNAALPRFEAGLVKPIQE